MQIETGKCVWGSIFFVGLVCLIAFIGCYTFPGDGYTSHTVPPDKTPPKIMTTRPKEKAVLSYSTRPKEILVTFSENIPFDGSIIVLRHKDAVKGAVKGAANYRGRREVRRLSKQVRFVPEKPLMSGVYLVTIEGFRDQVDNVMDKYEFSFEVLQKPTWFLIGKEMQRLTEMQNKLNEAIEKKIIVEE